MNFQTLNKQRKFILIAALLGVISLFLPWTSVSVLGYSQSTNGFHSFGIAVFLFFIGSVILSLLGDQAKPLDKNMWIASLAAGVLNVLFTVIFMANISDVAGAGMGFVDAGFGFGIWIALLASVGIIISAWFFKNPSDNLKDSFASIKKGISIPSNPVVNSNAGKPAANTNKIAELEKLIELKNQGNISEEEYQQLKSKLL